VRGKGVGEGPNIPEGIWLEKCWGHKKRARADWESVRKRAN